MAELLFPLQFKRQYSGPLDADSVFQTKQAMTDYLTSPLRYPGQLGFCMETGEYKYLNATKDAWVPLGGGKCNFIVVENHTELLTITPTVRTMAFVLMEETVTDNSDPINVVDITYPSGHYIYDLDSSSWTSMDDGNLDITEQEFEDMFANSSGFDSSGNINFDDMFN